MTPPTSLFYVTQRALSAPASRLPCENGVLGYSSEVWHLQDAEQDTEEEEGGGLLLHTGTWRAMWPPSWASSRRRRVSRTKRSTSSLASWGAFASSIHTPPISSRRSPRRPSPTPTHTDPRRLKPLHPKIPPWSPWRPLRDLNGRHCHLQRWLWLCRRERGGPTSHRLSHPHARTSMALA